MPDLTSDNQEWKISYPSKTELLCETCGQTFTYTSALRRHMKIQHKPRNLICHERDYQTPRRDNMRRRSQNGTQIGEGRSSKYFERSLYH